MLNHVSNHHRNRQVRLHPKMLGNTGICYDSSTVLTSCPVTSFFNFNEMIYQQSTLHLQRKRKDNNI